MSAPPRPVRVLVRSLLRGGDADRALADLADVYESAMAAHGRRAAAWTCAREALLIVAWSWFGGLRREPAVRPSQQRDVPRHGMGAGMGEDLRFGARALARRPGFTALTVVVLALGIGANVTIFTVANRLFLDAPPEVDSPDRLVRLFRSWAPGQGGSMSYPTYLDFRDGATQLSGLMAYSPSGIATTARTGGDPVPARVWPVTDNYFDVLGLRPAAGRFFTPEENATPGTHAVAVLSHGFWLRVVGGARDIVGAQLRLNGTTFTVIGVAAGGFRGLGPAETAPDVFIPIMMRDAVMPASDAAWRERIADLRENWLTVVGRLAPAATFDAARGELVAIAARIAELHPEHSEGESVHVSQQFRYLPSTERTLGDITRVLLMVVALVLAIASANAAILLLSRSSARVRELGIRAAIGAGRGRVVRLLLAESLLLGLAGGVLGVVLSLWGARVAGALLPVPIPDASPDARVLLVALAVSLLTAALVGSAPALRAARAGVTDMIHARGSSGRSSRTQAGLVVLQVALSLVLMTGAAVFARSLTAARSRDIGFSTDRTLLVEMNLRNHGYDAERGRIFVADAVERVRELPGIRSVSTQRMVPFRGDWTTTLEPWPGARFENALEISLDVVAPGYFEAVEMPIVRGRYFDARDVLGGPPAIVINQTLADAVFPGSDPIGQTVPLRGPNGPAFTVVGVVQNATYHRLGEAPVLRAYGPFDQAFQLGLTLVIRTAGPPLDHAVAVRDAIATVDPEVALANVATMSAIVDREIARFRVTARMVGLFGGLALTLAAAGLYGVLSAFVQRKRREIGVCMALGATRRRIARSVLRRGMGLALAGVAIGIVVALGFAR
ncbi:MAG: ADOP family duplicated permease, partial [Gemmatimonadetes bacterium]|nr:ADOP family duplicated permease [Gemmatimonadota bacterium]